MNVKRYTARTSREALVLVRQALGDDAVVLSTRPSAEGIEVLAMASDDMSRVERMATPSNAAARARRADTAPVLRANDAAHTLRSDRSTDSVMRTVPGDTRLDSGAEDSVERDVEQLAMSTLSFQDYVRERMLKRRQTALQQAEQALAGAPVELPPPAPMTAPTPAPRAATPAPAPRAAAPAPRAAAAPAKPKPRAEAKRPVPTIDFNFDDLDAVPEPVAAPAPAPAPAPVAQPRVEPVVARRDQVDMMTELRAMKGLIEERFGALAFMDKLQRQPKHALLAQKLLDCGFSPVLVRKLVDAMPLQVDDEIAWATSVLERNVMTGEGEEALEDQNGVFALIGSTGVGKTTTTAKIAAAFATQHGASQLGLITLDAYRIAAHEQLRAYGRILGVPVHTAHDRASLEDLLELLAGKRMVLIDTAGMAQRDSRTREMLDMLQHRSIQRLLVIDSAAQGETIDDVIVSWKAAQCKGVILSKIDEAVKLAPALDALIRRKLKVMGVATGQRVPEDWHRLSANALLHRALRGGGSAAFRMDADDVQLVFAMANGGTAGAAPLRT